MTKNFKVEEFACTCGCGDARISPTIVLVWQMVRDHFKKPVTINSGLRCEARNKAVGGVSSSQHLVKDFDNQAHAADGFIEGVPPIEIYNYVAKIFPNSLGVGVYDTFVHIDDRLDRAYRWDNRKV